MVSASFPDGFTLPNKISASAAPTACPQRYASKIAFRETAQLGMELESFGTKTLGTRNKSDVGIIFDWDNYWGNSEPKQGQRSQSARGFCPRCTMRVPQPDIIEHFGNADAVPQLPERCLSRKAGIVRCCPNFSLQILPAHRFPLHNLCSDFPVLPVKFTNAILPERS